MARTAMGRQKARKLKTIVMIRKYPLRTGILLLILQITSEGQGAWTCRLGNGMGFYVVVDVSMVVGKGVNGIINSEHGSRSKVRA